MARGANHRATHLGNLAVAALKYLLLNAESDDMKFKAAEALLALAPVRRKLDLSATVVDAPVMDRKSADRPAVLGQRLRRLMDAGAEQATEALRLIEEAEKQAGLTANPREPHPKLLADKPSR